MIPLRDHRRSGLLPIVTILLIAANLLAFLFEVTATHLDQFISQYALIPGLLSVNRALPILTHQFLHAGWIHLLSNMIFLWVFGDNVEARLGSVKFFLFYLGAGVLAAAAQTVVSLHSLVPMLGASGAIAGVLGVYLVWFPDSTIDTLILGFGYARVIAIPAGYLLGYWFLFQVIGGVGSVAVSAIGGVAFIAHIGGFASGYLAARSGLIEG